MPEGKLKPSEKAQRNYKQKCNIVECPVYNERFLSNCTRIFEATEKGKTYECKLRELLNTRAEGEKCKSLENLYNKVRKEACLKCGHVGGVKCEECLYAEICNVIDEVLNAEGK